MENNNYDILKEVRVNHKDKNSVNILTTYLKKFIDSKSVLVCIGTDRCIGDCLGPMVGTILRKNSYPYPLYGTIDYPVHAINLPDVVYKVRFNHPSSKIIAIDACLGNTSSIGDIILRRGAIHPGKGVGKKLPSVGDISIVGIVNYASDDDFASIHNIRLSLIMSMSEVIAQAVLKAL